MQQRPVRSIRRPFFLAGTAFLLVAVLACAFAWPLERSAQASELAQAEQRWNMRPFGHYRLIIRDKNCEQRIEVRNERILDVSPNRCEAPPRTISDLFTLIRRDGSISTRCITLGCMCDDVIRVSARYDPELGYPQQIIVRIKAEPNMLHADFWKRAVSQRALPSCDVLAEGSKLIRIVSITPVQ